MQMSLLRKTFHFLESEEHKEDIQSSSVIESPHYWVFHYSSTMKELPPHFKYPPLSLNIVNQQNTKQSFKFLILHLCLDNLSSTRSSFSLSHPFPLFGSMESLFHSHPRAYRLHSRLIFLFIHLKYIFWHISPRY